uniref:ADAM metallopeptidase domain 28 n=1 Tax=Salmo trutta TaxID=8032 RepID=A0A673YWA1_SALTR
MHCDRMSVVLVRTLKHVASIPFQYKKMESNLGMLRKRIFEVVNFVNMVYKPLNTFIALVGLEVWSDSDKISVTAPAGATLDAFTTWRNNYLVKIKPNDNAHLISGIDFEGSTVGLAFIGTLCSGHSAGVVQDHNARAIAVGATLAHEMGHNLGMNHDDSSACACSGNSCIMAGALSTAPLDSTSFSSCSSLSYDQFLNNRNPECLLNKPDYRNVESTPVCGNGFLEKGEECDCGSLEECTNPCCNATSCTLTKGSECAAGECCEDCKIMASSTECRRKQDDCDLAEYCTGNSAVCPEDVFSVNGISCDRGRGYCRNGQCPQHHDQCVKMYGPSAEKATTYCYDQNTRGLYYAYCRRPSQDQFIPCQSQDVQCGKLFCKNGNDDPNYGRMVKFSDCKATFYGDYTSDFGQVNPGTKCNDGKVCNENECVDLETAYGPKATNCSARCKGHAVSTAPLSLVWYL